MSDMKKLIGAVSKLNEAYDFDLLKLSPQDRTKEQTRRGFAASKADAEVWHKGLKPHTPEVPKTKDKFLGQVHRQDDETTVDEDIEEDYEEDCPACNGTGRDFNGEGSEACLRCGGKGHLLNGGFDERTNGMDESTTGCNDGICLGAHVFPHSDKSGSPMEVISIVDDQRVKVKDDYGNVETMFIKDLVLEGVEPQFSAATSKGYVAYTGSKKEVEEYIRKNSGGADGKLHIKPIKRKTTESDDGALTEELRVAFEDYVKNKAAPADEKTRITITYKDGHTQTKMVTDKERKRYETSDSVEKVVDAKGSKGRLDDTKLSEGFGRTYAEIVAQNLPKGLDDENQILDDAYDYVLGDKGAKTARNLLHYTEDFPSDVVTAYNWLEQGGRNHVTESDDDVDPTRNYWRDIRDKKMADRQARQEKKLANYRKRLSAGKVDTSKFGYQKLGGDISPDWAKNQATMQEDSSDPASYPTFLQYVYKKMKNEFSDMSEVEDLFDYAYLSDIEFDEVLQHIGAKTSAKKYLTESLVWLLQNMSDKTYTKEMKHLAAEWIMLVAGPLDEYAKTMVEGKKTSFDLGSKAINEAKGGFGGSVAQAQHEITWLKNKIAELQPKLAKRPSTAKEIKDLERQIRERELAIGFQDHVTESDNSDLDGDDFVSDAEYNKLAAHVKQKYPGFKLSGVSANSDSTINYQAMSQAGKTVSGVFDGKADIDVTEAMLPKGEEVDIRRKMIKYIARYNSSLSLEDLDQLDTNTLKTEYKKCQQKRRAWIDARSEWWNAPDSDKDQRKKEMDDIWGDGQGSLQFEAKGKSENRELWDKINSKGVQPPIDRERYTDLSHEGLEGPFRMKTGAILYYDPKEGKYYNRDTDMFVSNEEMDEINRYGLSENAPAKKSMSPEKLAKIAKMRAMLEKLGGAVKEARSKMGSKIEEEAPIDQVVANAAPAGSQVTTAQPSAGAPAAATATSASKPGAATTAVAPAAPSAPTPPASADQAKSTATVVKAITDDPTVAAKLKSNPAAADAVRTVLGLKP